MSTDDVSRRRFIRTAGGAAGVAGATAATTGTAAAQEEQPVWPSGAEGNVGSYQDARGESEVTVEVGAGDSGLAFDPTLLWVDTGTTISFEWTGSGGAHNVQTVEDGGPADLDSGDPTSDGTNVYEYETSEEDAGITHYHCVPHTTTGMHGGLAVGDDVETESTGGGGGSDAVFVPQGARALGVATFIAMVSTLGLAFVFMKYGGTITGEE